MLPAFVESVQPEFNTLDLLIGVVGTFEAVAEGNILPSLFEKIIMPVAVERS